MLALPPKRKKEQSDCGGFRRFLPHTVRVWLGIGTAVLLSICLAGNFQAQRFTLSVGQVIPRDIRASQTTSFLDTTMGLPATGSPSAARPRALVEDRQASLDALDDLASAIRQIRDARASSGSEASRAAMVQRSVASLPLPVIVSLLRVAPADFGLIARAASAALAVEVTEQPVSDAVGELDLARTDLANRTRSILQDPGKASLATSLAGAFVRPTMTEVPLPPGFRLPHSLPDNTQVYVTVHKNEILARKGDIATASLVHLLDTLGLIGPQSGFLWQICMAALSLGSYLAVVLFLRFYYPALYADTRRLCLLAFIVVTAVIALRFLGFVLGLRLTPSQYGFFALMWVTAAGMLVATLIRAEVAILVAALLSLHTAIILDSQLQFGMTALFSALAGIYSIRRIRQRSDILRSMGVIGVVNLVSVWVMTIWNEGPMMSQLRHDLGVATVWALVAGLMSPVLFFVGVAVLERLFHITTDLNLMELCDNRQPLLRRLVLEAPGTYAHSVGVASLAEAAADAVGADSLMVRTGALYHDIGKICRPYFFIENQHGDNLHDKLSPTMSAKIITAHIADGVELAREYKLPEVVSDFIRQHHGTSLVTYFYHQAIITSDSPAGIPECCFHYCGPRPQTREAGILMLADTVESVVRSSLRKHPGRVDAIVARAIQGRLAEGQLKECDLTFREIDTIQAVFVRVLSAIHHHRIEYPAAAGASEERLVAGAGSGR